MKRPGQLILAAATALLLTSTALAAPAEVVLVIDTSASMLEPSGGPGDETKLDRAKEIVADLAAVLGASGHRVGLFRFRQKTVTVMTGQGAAAVQAEDPGQCDLATDLVVPMEVGTTAQIVRWVDGVATQADPELVALGDSPLYNTARAVLGFFRGSRHATPLRSCVNAVVVFVTDGEDTCAAGAQLFNFQAQLRAQSVAEDIRAYVVAFDPESDTARVLAQLGHEAETAPAPYGFDDAGALVTALADLQGRPSPAGCLVSGVPTEEVFPSGVPDGFVDPRDPVDPTVGAGEDSDGCSASSASTGLGLAALALLLAFGLRRRRTLLAALVAVTLGGAACGDDGPATTTDTGDTVGGDSAVGSDPSAEAEADLALLDALLDAIPAIRDAHLLPHFDPTLRFAAVDGDPVAGCLALARSVDYTSTRRARRGAAGCLATNRCNSVDHALLAQACLAYHGVTATVEQCRPSGGWSERAAALAETPTDPALPSAQPAIDALDAAVEAVLGDNPDLADYREASVEIPEMVEEHLTRSVETTTDALFARLPDLGVEPDAGLDYILREVDLGDDWVFVVVIDETRYDPVLADSPLEEDGGCFNQPVNLPNETVEVTVEVLVEYARVQNNTFSPRGLVSLGSVAVPVADHWGERVAVAITDATVDAIPEGVPPEATSNCLHALVRVGGETTALSAFQLLSPTDGVSDCPGETASPPLAIEQLVRVVLRTRTQVTHAHTVDRVLFDRYGYARDNQAAAITGPQYSIESTRTFLPMRVDLLFGEGIPLAVKLLDEKLADLHARKDELRRRYAIERYGVLPPDQAPDDPPLSLLPYDWQTLAHFAWKAHTLLPSDSTLVWERPWRLATIRRRGFGPTQGGLEVVGQRIFDIIDAPVMVVPNADADVDPADRQRANLALGVLLTEAERLASVGYDHAVSPLNAAALYRDDAENWAPVAVDSAAPHYFGLYPDVVETAWRQRRASGEEVLASLPTGAPFEGDGNAYLAWWRVDELTGMTIGEMRYDGTFYGGASAVATYVATLTYCLASQAVAALSSAERVIPDVACCFKIAFNEFVKAALLDYAQSVGFSNAGFYASAIGNVALTGGSIIKSVRDNFVTYEDAATGLLKRPEECEE